MSTGRHVLKQRKAQRVQAELDWLLDPHFLLAPHDPNSRDEGFGKVARMVGEIFCGRFNRNMPDVDLASALAVRAFARLLERDGCDEVVYRSSNGAVEQRMSDYLPDVCATFVYHYRALIDAAGDWALELYLRAGHPIAETLLEDVKRYADSFTD